MSTHLTRPFARVSGLLSLWFVIAGLHVSAQTPVAKEYQVKAAFIYNFTRFTEWPNGSFANENSPITIGVLGKNPFGDELEKIVQGRAVFGRPLTIVYFPSAESLRPERGVCHVLFVAPGEERVLLAMSARLEKAGILTVGESDHFLAGGGVINFAVVGDKARFEINLKAAEQTGLKLSAQLLKLASTIRR